MAGAYPCKDCVLTRKLKGVWNQYAIKRKKLKNVNEKKKKTLREKKKILDEGKKKKNEWKVGQKGRAWRRVHYYNQIPVYHHLKESSKIL